MLAVLLGCGLRRFEVAALTFGHTSLTFALGVSFPGSRRRIHNAFNTGSREKAWVKTLPLVRR